MNKEQIKEFVLAVMLVVLIGFLAAMAMGLSARDLLQFLLMSG